MQKISTFSSAFSTFMPLFVLSHRQFYYQRHIILTALAAKRCLISAYLTAFGASVHYYKALFSIGNDLYRLKLAATLVGSVARIYINVERPKAKRTVVARGISKRLDLSAAVGADKGIIVFRKSLLFHITSPLRQALREISQKPRRLLWECQTQHCDP